MADEFEDEQAVEYDGWDDTDDLPVRSPGRFIAQIVLLVAAVMLFLWLVNVFSADPVWPSLVDGLSEGAWIGLLLTLLLIDLLVVILLLRPKWVQRAMDGHPLFDDDPTYMVGCPGCGTTFDRRHHEIDETHEKRFACPNCGREGELKSMKRQRAHVDDHWCTSCDQHYRVYQDHSECPHCHTSQQHAIA